MSGNPQARHVARIAAVIAQSKPDIVCLQELDVGRMRTGGVDQAHAIASRLGMSFHFGPAMKVAEEQYGDAILTALPMRLIKVGGLPTLPRVRGLEPRGAVWVAIEVEPGIEVQVVNTHLGLVPLEQRHQVDALMGKDWLGAGASGQPLILIGDFNATSRYACYKRLTHGLRDAQRVLQQTGKRPRTVRTFPSRFPMLRIDHLFLSPKVEIVDVHANIGPLARAASDHLPLVADFRVAG